MTKNKIRIIKYPNGNTWMTGSVDEQNRKQGDWKVYSPDNLELMILKYIDDKLAGEQLLINEANMEEGYNVSSYNYDYNEMKNVEMRQEMGPMFIKYNEFGVVSTQKKRHRVHSYLPAIGEYFFMSVEDQLNTFTDKDTFIYYIPIEIFEIEAPSGFIAPLYKNISSTQFVICVELSCKKVYDLWTKANNESTFNAKMIEYLDIKNRIINNRLVFNEYSDNLRDLIRSYDNITNLDIRFEGNVRLGKNESFGWTGSKSVNFINGVRLVIPKIIISGNPPSANYLLNKRWLSNNFSYQLEEHRNGKVYEFPISRTFIPNPAELYPDTSWELITTDLYIEHLSGDKTKISNRDENDRLKPATIQTVEVTNSSINIKGLSYAKKVILYFRDKSGKYYPKVIIQVTNNTWRLNNARYLIPNKITKITDFTLYTIPIYKEGFGQLSTHDIKVNPMDFSDMKVPDKLKPNNVNINTVDNNDRPIYIWRRTGDYEKYHPYLFEGPFKEYCPQAPEGENLFRECKYVAEIGLNNTFINVLDGPDNMYYHNNKVIERNWDMGTLNPTMKLWNTNGDKLATVTIKNDNVYSGIIYSKNGEAVDELKFINPKNDSTYNNIKILNTKSYKDEKIYDEIDNKKE